MTRPRLIRGLRIAWSVWWAILCLLLLVVWVRSYWWRDLYSLRLAGSVCLEAQSAQGRMIVWLRHRPQTKRLMGFSAAVTQPFEPGRSDRIPWFDFYRFTNVDRLYTAHWFLTVLAGAVALLPWCPRRFGVRGLFVATTAVAILILLLAWVDRHF